MAQQKTAAEIAKEGASNLNRFSKATKSDPNKKQPDIVGRIQAYGKQEIERKKKEEAEKKKKASQPVQTAPQEGFLTRMYKKYISGEK